MGSFENTFSHCRHIGCCCLVVLIQIHISDIPHYILPLSCLLCCGHTLFWNKNKQTRKQYIYMIYVFTNTLSILFLMIDFNDVFIVTFKYQWNMIKFRILHEVIFYQEFGFDTIPSIFLCSIGGIEYQYKVFFCQFW